MSAVTGFVASASLAFTPIHVDGLFIDGFAGGGGASTGIEQAIGRSVDIAINHSPTAIAIHKANHPATTHFCQDIKAVWPLAATRMQPVAGAWFSPDCKEFSKAKGGPVKDRSIRALCWEVVTWLKEVLPTCGYLENVEEFEYAAPLDGARRPIAGQEGREFKRFVKAIRALGYRVKWFILRACDYGAPTSRKRLYMVMRRDGKPIVKPKPTHGAPGSAGVRSGKLLPYRTAAECIDWSIECPSIFDRKRDLAEATKRRIAHGVMRYVVNAAEPFIVRTAHGDDGRHRTHPIGEPLGTQPASNEFSAVDVTVAPHVTKFHSGSVGSAAGEPMPTITANGKPARPAGSTPLGMVEAVLAPHVMTNRNAAKPFTAADEPTHTITACGAHQNVVGATLVGVGGRRGQSAPMPVDGSYPTTTAKADAAIACATLVQTGYGERPGQQPRVPHLDKPLGAAVAGGVKHAAVTALLSSFYGSDKRGSGGDPEKPLRAARAGGQHHAVVAAHMEQANTGCVGHSPRKPLSTIVGRGCTQRIVETMIIEADALPPGLAARAQVVAAFLIKYYGDEDDGHGLAAPIHTVTTKDRFAVVTATIDAKTYVVVDIGLRMLKPRELARAQGFPDNYVLDPECWYVTKPSKKFPQGQRKFGRLPIAEQISAIGNSVCPPVARALVLANQPSSAEPVRMAA
jgi:DNA (cytosine-5)-methyltransferase 1